MVSAGEGSDFGAKFLLFSPDLVVSCSSLASVFCFACLLVTVELVFLFLLVVQ